MSLERVRPITTAPSAYLRGWDSAYSAAPCAGRAGDVVSCNCGRKHWHGATDTTSISHIAIQNWQDGTPVNWLERVRDDQNLSAVEPD